MKDRANIMRAPKHRERTFHGLPVSPGIGFGVAHVRNGGVLSVPAYSIPANRAKAEATRFHRAVGSTRRQVSSLRSRIKALPGPVAEEMDFLFEAYLQMLRDSRLVRGVERRIVEDRINAEAAVQAELAEIAAVFSAMDDAYIAARLEDIREVAARLLRNLSRGGATKRETLVRNSIVVSTELTPADTALLDPRRVNGLATVMGGVEGHTAIMARALGLPAVLGAAGLTDVVRSGDPLIVDGEEGVVIVHPRSETAQAFRHRRGRQRQQVRRMAGLRNRPAVSHDGTAVTLRANVELPVEMPVVRQMGAEGIGLLRTEFMFMNRPDLPSEDEQFAILRDIVTRADGHPVTVRSVDVGGGEKISEALAGDFGASASSALGLRGIRLSLRRLDVLSAQFRAILRAGAHGNLRILLPMVTNVSEVRRARAVLRRAARQVRERGLPMAESLPPLGVMIEVPAAALSADALVRASDFLAIGTNDLTMYTLAIDRIDEQVAPLFDPLHPAVLRLIGFAADAGARAGVPVSVCGEMAGDPRCTALLMGMGIRELSMAAASIPRVKRRIRSLRLAEAVRHAEAVLSETDPKRIAAALDGFSLAT